jgi:uncharacterized protein DUF1775
LHRRPEKLVIGAAFAALVAITAQASAHVTVGIPTLEVTDVNYRVPVEPAPTTPEELAQRHNEQLVVNVPVGFKVDQCHETADFSCTVDAGAITWTRRAESTNYRPADFFRASLRTPGIGGTFLFPAVQTYSDGEEVSWSDPATSDPHPAPQLRVNGPDRAPVLATGTFRPLAELGAGTPCPQEVIDDAIRLGIDPAVHCGHFGFEPPAGTPAPPAPPEPGPDVRGTAQLVRTETSTFVEVVVTGLEPGVTYDAHLHEGTCTNPTSAHYRNDPAGLDGPPNELWPTDEPANPSAGLTADETGMARGYGVAEWIARPTARAIWIHEPPADPNDPHAHARIGCADLV